MSLLPNLIHVQLISKHLGMRPYLIQTSTFYPVLREKSIPKWVENVLEQGPYIRTASRLWRLLADGLCGVNHLPSLGPRALAFQMTKDVPFDHYDPF